MVGSPCSPGDSQESSPTPQFKRINSLALSFFTVQLSHPYMTTGKTIALTRRTFVGKVMSLLINMQVVQTVKCLPTMQETWVRSLGGEDPLEKEMATYSSTLAWKIPRTEEPGRYSPWSCKESDMTE